MSEREKHRQQTSLCVSSDKLKDRRYKEREREREKG